MNSFPRSQSKHIARQDVETKAIWVQNQCPFCPAMLPLRIRNTEWFADSDKIRSAGPAEELRSQGRLL